MGRIATWGDPVTGTTDVMPKLSVRTTALVVCCVFVVSCLGTGVAADPAVDMSDTIAPEQTGLSSVQTVPGHGQMTQANDSDDTTEVREAAYEEPAPEPGDPYFEAADDEGHWISYINPRDEYRDPYLGDGSGKLCVTLLNAEGEVVAGETVPNTTVTVPTGESVSWHASADPFVVRFPLTEHYERPLDSDQFGTASDLPQGDGYLDAHCIEWHGLPEDEHVAYGEATVDGEYADRIEVVGYIQTEHEAWDTDLDPRSAAEPYERAGGWTYRPDGSHGQAVVVLQLDHGEGSTEGSAESEASDAESRTGSTDGRDDGSDSASGAGSDGGNEDGSTASGEEKPEAADDSLSGFGVLLACLSIIVAGASIRRRSAGDD